MEEFFGGIWKYIQEKKVIETFFKLVQLAVVSVFFWPCLVISNYLKPIWEKLMKDLFAE